MTKPSTRPLRDVFGENVRRERLALGLSQEAFADKTGLDRSYIGQVERGTRNIGIDNIEKIASALDLEAGTLLAAWAQH